MAIYEQDGPCPADLFFYFHLHHQEVSENIKKVDDILGDRKGYMVYGPDHDDRFRYTSIVECLFGSAVGISVANYLADLIPVCVYGETGKKIRIHDIINPKTIADDVYWINELKNVWTFTINGEIDTNHPVTKKDSRKLFFDKDWFVLIDNQETAVEIYLYRKLIFPEVES